MEPTPKLHQSSRLNICRLFSLSTDFSAAVRAGYHATSPFFDQVQHALGAVPGMNAASAQSRLCKRTLFSRRIAPTGSGRTRAGFAECFESSQSAGLFPVAHRLRTGKRGEAAVVISSSDVTSSTRGIALRRLQRSRVFTKPIPSRRDDES